MSASVLVDRIIFMINVQFYVLVILIQRFRSNLKFIMNRTDEGELYHVIFFFLEES